MNWTAPLRVRYNSDICRIIERVRPLLQITQQTIKNGLRSGVDTLWELAKAIIPLTILINVLRQTGWLEHLADTVTPIMAWFGLPGEGALVLVAGYFINVYSAIAAILTLELTVKQITVLAAMVSICHSIFLETAITKKTGVKVLPLALLRLGLSCLVGVIVHVLYPTPL